MGFFDLEFKMDDINKHEPPLQKLDKVINWEIFRPILESELLNKNKGKGGRPPFDKLLMFKILILQRSPAASFLAPSAPIPAGPSGCRRRFAVSSE